MRTLAILLLSAVLLGCGAKTVRVDTSPSVPAAGAWIKVDEDRNNNTEYRVEIRHLAPPEKLTPPRSAYVFWIQAAGQQPENAGQIVLDDRLRGSLRGVTPHREFIAFVTAEDLASTPTPTGEEVMRTTIER